jgi:hypothetical protein
MIHRNGRKLLRKWRTGGSSWESDEREEAFEKVTVWLGMWKKLFQYFNSWHSFRVISWVKHISLLTVSVLTIPWRAKRVLPPSVYK